MRIFQRSLRNLFKDPAKIFGKILQDLQGFYQEFANILGKSQQDLSWILKILVEDLVELVRFSNKYDFTLFKVVHVISLSADIIRTPYHHL